MAYDLKSDHAEEKIIPSRVFFDRMDAVFEENAKRVFAELADGSLSYEQCYAEMHRYASGFETSGIVQGSRILIRSSQDRQIIPLFLAALRSGVTPVIADPQATDVELADLIDRCDVHAVFVEKIASEWVKPPKVAHVEFAQVGEHQSSESVGAQPSEFTFPSLSGEPELAMLVLTSGTTSTPKAVELTFANLVAQLNTISAAYSFDKDSRLLNLLPLHHVDGLIRGPLAALWNGGAVLRKKKFAVETTQEILRSVAKDSVTHIVTVPAMLRIMERLSRDGTVSLKTPHFNCILCSADALDSALWRRCEELFNVPVVNSYGLSEVTCDVLIAGPDDATRKIGTLGRPVDCSTRIVDSLGNDVSEGQTGELVISGPIVMRGYFQESKATEAVLKDGEFFTGDYFRITPDGFYEFMGRKKTAIVTAGSTIHPETAAQALLTMPSVLEAIAFGVPDEAIGQKLVAALVPVEGHNISVADAALHCRSLLSVERSPRDYIILTSLPRGTTGKVVIDALIESYLENRVLKADVLTIAAECFNVSVTELSLDSTPFNTANWDSLAHLTLIESIEEAFGLQFSPAEISQIISLKDAKLFVDQILENNQNS
jgi:long-chain acyl-CoA synthetase